MQCKRCDGPMMTETVIKLRRSVFGFRETRSLGAYCPMCQIGVPAESQPALAGRAAMAMPRSRIASVWPFRLPGGPSRPGRRRISAMPPADRLGDPLSLAR
jgi:hypothetical protein